MIDSEQMTAARARVQAALRREGWVNCQLGYRYRLDPLPPGVTRAAASAANSWGGVSARAVVQTRESRYEWMSELHTFDELPVLMAKAEQELRRLAACATESLRHPERVRDPNGR